MNKKRFRIRISNRSTDHIINAVLIFASVFLAFWLNEVRVEKNGAELARNAMNAILTEWKINLSILERSKSYHQTILNKGEQTLLKNLDTLKRFDVELIPGIQGAIQKETITSSSKGLISDQQFDFDLKTRLTINQINEQQDYLTKAINALSNDFLNQRELLDPTKIKENYLMFYSLLEKLIDQETIMIQRLEAVIYEFSE